jgi:hypothetical protein
MAVPQPQQPGLPEGCRYYLLRGTNIVPLIPADQLPIEVQDISHQLTHRQMSNGNWKFSHETEHTAVILAIQTPSSFLLPQSTTPPKPRFLAPDHCVRHESSNPSLEAPNVGSVQIAPQAVEKAPGPTTPVWDTTPDRSASLADTLTSIYPKDAQRFNYRVSHPSGTVPDQSKKVYCTHWIKTGECAYTSYNCKFKHEMPNPNKLRELGFTRMPRWYKERTAIGVREPTWMQQRLARGSEDGNRLAEMQPPRVFPDPSTFRSKQVEEQGKLHGGSRSYGTLPKPATISPTKRLRAVSPPAPTPEAASRCESQISNLLIDFDDIPAPSPPSPQLSERSCSSINSYSSEDCPAPSSASSLPHQIDELPVTTISRIATKSGGTTKKATDNQLVAAPVVRLKTLASHNPAVEDDIAPAKPPSKTSATPRQPALLSKASPKQASLANSRYAVTNKEKPTPIETQNKDLHRKMLQLEEKIVADPKANHARGRRVARRNGRTKRGTGGDEKTVQFAVKKTSG